MIGQTERNEIRQRLLSERGDAVEPEVHPESLPITEIHAEPDLFQQRNIPKWQSENHIQTLVKSLRHQKGPLEPLSVFFTGRRYVVVDGHHRHGAYTSVGWTKGVPFRVFAGTLQEAIQESLRSNSKDKMPMSRSEKSDAAWRFVCDEGGCLSKRELAQIANISEGTIAAMRRAVRELRATGHKDPSRLTWREAKLKASEAERGEYDHEKHTQRLTERLLKAFPHGDLMADPEALNGALQRYSERDWVVFVEHCSAREEGESEADF